MKEKPLKNNSSREYSPEFTEQVGYYAQNGSSPTQIVTLLQLQGMERAHFIEDICRMVHPLFVEYRRNLKINAEDVDATLARISLMGEPMLWKFPSNVKCATISMN